MTDLTSRWRYAIVRVMELAKYLRTFPRQQDAADLFGVDQSTIAHWISGRRRPTPGLAKRIAKASRGKVTLDDIYRDAA